MKHFLIISISYDIDPPKEVLDRIIDLYDKKKEVDLQSDDFVTLFPETLKGKQIAININFESKDYKTAVFDIMAKAHNLGTGWKIIGPVRMKKYFFSMSLDKETADKIIPGINGISIILNNSLLK